MDGAGYGSLPEDDHETTSDTEDDHQDTFISDDSIRRSFHYVNPANVLTRRPTLVRNEEMLQRHPSFAQEEYETVPTELTHNNTKLVLDPALENYERGQLFYSESSMYHPEQSPFYALTVNTDLYRRIFQEVVDSQRIPCGLYFCCHGGDDTHIGLSPGSDSFVDIRVAWTLVIIMFATMLIVSSDGAD